MSKPLDNYDKEILDAAVKLLNKRFEIHDEEIEDAACAKQDACVYEAAKYFKDPDDASEVGMRLSERIKFVPARFIKK